MNVDEDVTSWIDPLLDWLRHTGLTVVVVCIAAFVAVKVVGLIARRRQRSAEAKRGEGPEAIGSMVGAQVALIGALRWAVNFTIVFVAIIWILIELNLPEAALVPLASVVGAGLGFGAQQIVGDVLAGIFILSERQFGVGDLVRVGPLVGVGWVEGHVHEMTLRVTKLRTFDGDIVTIANGELRQSVNASRDWARVVVMVPLGRDVDLELVSAQLDEIGQQLAADPAWDDLVIETPKVSGVDDLGADTVQLRVVGRTLPAQQRKVGRELRRRIALALRDLHIPVQQPTGEHIVQPDD
jgi:small-conductance mechanosensitive channel